MPLPNVLQAQWCFCGNGTDRTEQTGCNPCTANDTVLPNFATLECGGSYRMSVYECKYGNVRGFCVVVLFEQPFISSIAEIASTMNRAGEGGCVL